MVNKDQLKALLDSYFEEDQERFITVALQVAASAAKKGQNNLASDLKEIIDRGREKSKKVKEKNLLNFSKLSGEVSNLLNVTYPELRLRDVVFSEEIDHFLRKLIGEQKQRFKLKEYNLLPLSKLLLVGPPGTGKTLTANVIAGELNLPLYTVQFENLLSKFMGESASKLKLIFDQMVNERGIYLFDEFDAIGAKRSKENDVGEIRRVLNSFLQQLENSNSDSIIVAATNHREMLDEALFRRFDNVLEYNNPDKNVIEALLKDRLFSFVKNEVNWKNIASHVKGLNHSEIVKSCNQIAKEIILNPDFFLSEDSIIPFFKKQ